MTHSERTWRPKAVRGFTSIGNFDGTVAGGHIVGGVVAWLHEDRSSVSSEVAHIRASEERKLRHRGRRETIVLFLGGAQLRFSTPYLSVDYQGCPGRRRGVGRRGKAGGGCYPVLEGLGIRHQASPALASEVARQSVRCSSFEEASEALGERGLSMDAKGVRTLALFVGNEALRQRVLRMAAAAAGYTFGDEFAGKRVVVSADGGRLRTRQYGGRRRRRKKGGRRYDTPWREPKLVIAYVIDDRGRKVRSIAPLIDVTLGDADAAFGLLISELLLRGAAKAKEIIVIGDGAPWIWNRVDALAHALEMAPEKIVRVADFYHAVEHLTAIADLRAGWTDAKKKKWVCKMRRRLRKGNVDKVIKEARDFCIGRHAKALARETAYFENRRDFMRYDQFRERGIPLGSGAVESAVRRVINLRLKGAGIFWLECAAEAMLHLRAYLKAGRWSELVNRVIHRSPDGTPRLPLEKAA